MLLAADNPESCERMPDAEFVVTEVTSDLSSLPTKNKTCANLKQNPSHFDEQIYYFTTVISQHHTTKIIL